jgi:hypothetical protein
MKITQNHSSLPAVTIIFRRYKKVTSAAEIIFILLFYREKIKSHFLIIFKYGDINFIIMST